MLSNARLRSAAVAFALVLGVSACGSSPTGSPEPGEGGGIDTATAAIAAVNAQLEGLDLEARRAKLIELAQAEGGEVSFYGSTNPEDVEPVISAFEEQTGISVSNYRADTSSVLRRIQEEASAGRVGADVTIGGRAEYVQLTNSGLLAEFETPIADQIHEGGVEPHGIDVYRVLRIVLWNTDRLTPDQYPTSWEDVLENYPGELILDPSDWDWFATFTQEYLMKEKGMTEDEAIAYWKEVAKGAVVISGHTLGTQLVTTGEYAISAVTYQHGLPPEGAPVEWEPPVAPVVTGSALISILANTARPATALLFTEFFLTDGQHILYEGGRSPANTTVPSAWPAEYDQYTIDESPELYTEPGQAEKWTDLWEEILTGGTVGQSG